MHPETYVGLYVKSALGWGEGGMQGTSLPWILWEEVKIGKKKETCQILTPKIESIYSKKFWEELIAYFHFTKYGVSDTTRPAQKTPRPTVLLFLRVYSLQRERVYRLVT
jgi:hypothetical protein